MKLVSQWSVNILYGEFNGVAVVVGDNEKPLTPLTTLTASDERVCAQCGGGAPDDPPTVRVQNGNAEAWVHADCRRFWVEGHR